MNKKTTKYQVQLTAAEEATLLNLISQGQPAARKNTRARILLKANEGFKDEQIAQALNVSTATVSRTRHKYVETGLEAAINHKPPAATKPTKFDGPQQAFIIATACSAVPDGKHHWTLRMLAAKTIELEMVESVSPETIRHILKKTNSNPGAKRCGVFPQSERPS